MNLNFVEIDDFTYEEKRRGALIGHLGGGYFLIGFHQKDNGIWVWHHRVVSGAEMSGWEFIVDEPKPQSEDETTSTSDRNVQFRRDIIGLEFQGEIL